MTERTFEHRGAVFALPADWKLAGQVDHRDTVIVIPKLVMMLAAGSAVVGGLIGVVLLPLVGNLHWGLSLALGAVSGAIIALLSTFVRIGRTKANLPVVLKGPASEIALLWVWRLPSTTVVPPLEQRLQPDAGANSPLGGTILERGGFLIDGEQQAIAIRQGPLEAICDPAWRAGDDVPYSADYEVFLKGSPLLHCRLYGVLTSPECPRRFPYEAIAASLRRA